MERSLEADYKIQQIIGFVSLSTPSGTCYYVNKLIDEILNRALLSDQALLVGLTC